MNNMATAQYHLEIPTKGRGLYDITHDIKQMVATSKIETGLCNIFLLHTSASIILCENADPTVQEDLEAFMQRLIPDDDALFKHMDEGPDDMPAHVRSVLTGNSLNLPIVTNSLALGRWQGVFLWEHRYDGHHRKVVVTVQGNG